MRTGISTGCLYPMLTKDSLEALSGQGFRLFEIFFNTFSELEPDYTDKLKRILERGGAEICSIHPFTSSYESFLLFSAYEKRFEDGLRFYEMYFRTARRMDCRYVIIHGLSDLFSYISHREYFRRFLLLAELANKFGVTLLQENVYKHIGNSPELFEEMYSCSSGAGWGFVLDTKQAVRGGCDPCDFLRAGRDRIRHIHISDHDKEGNCVLPGRGIYDFDKFFSCLKEINYTGDVIIEVYNSSYGETEELGAAAGFLRKYTESGRN